MEVFNSCQKEFNGALESANFSDIPAGTLEPDPQIQICAPRDENGTVIGWYVSMAIAEECIAGLVIVSVITWVQAS